MTRRLCSAVVLLVSALGGTAGAAPPERTIEGGTISGSRLSRLVHTADRVKLIGVTVRGYSQLSGEFVLETNHARFTDEVQVEVDRRQRIEAQSTNFDELLALTGSVDDCRACSATVHANGSRFDTGLVTIPGVAAFVLDFRQTRLDGLSTVGDFQSFECELCRIDGDLVLGSHSAQLVELLSSSGQGAISLRGRIDQFVAPNVRFEQPVDIESARLSRLYFPCRRSQTVYVRWEQLRLAWLEPIVAGLDRQKDERAVAQRLRREAQCWRDDLKANGRESDARHANHAAIQLNRDHVLRKWTSLDWWAAWILELPTSYGTAPWRLLLVSIGLIVLCAVVYAVVDPFEREGDAAPRPKNPLPLFSLLFSIETFVPVLQVTGVKDWGWHIGTSRLRWLEAFEGLLGGVLLLLAGYSLASYVF